jgi:16S rRNA (cytidine1402-2'-O)-methyltransferase
MQVQHTFSFFETPHRIEATLHAAATYSGNRPIMLGRELTKMHQEFRRGTAAELSVFNSPPRGEFTVIVGPAGNTQKVTEIQPSDASVYELFGRLTEHTGRTRRAAIGEVAKSFGISAKEVYAAVERAKHLGKQPQDAQ